MSEFKLNAGAVKTDMLTLYLAKNDLYLAKADLAFQILRLRMTSDNSAVSAIRSKLGVASKKIGNEIENINTIINTGNTVCSKARTAENAANFAMSGLADFLKITWPFFGAKPVGAVVGKNTTDLDISTLLTIMNFGIAGCVVGNAISTLTSGGFDHSLVGLDGKTGAHGKINGIDVGYDAEGSVLNVHGEGKAGAEWDFEKGNVTAGASGSIGFSALKGKVSANVGNTKVSAEGKVLNADAEGSIGISLFQNKKFAPSVYAGAKAKASVAEGSVSAQHGSDEFNVHTKAEGTVLAAEAEAKVQAGRIVDEKGNERWGASATAGAEAYLAKGKVSKGFTLFGVKFDASIEGKAGGAGVKAGGEVSTGGAEGEIGAGLGLGVGLKFKVDWSGFKAPKLKWPW